MKMTDNVRRAVTITLILCAVVFAIVYTLANIGAVTGVLSSVLSVLSPILIGFAIAYILNPLLRVFEFHAYKKIKKKSVLRALSIVSTYVVAVACVVAFFWLIIPSLISAITDLVNNYDLYIGKTTNLLNGIIARFVDNESVSEYVNDAAIKDAIASFFSASGNVLDAVVKYIVEYGSGLFTGIKNTILGIFISIYVLISKEKLQAQLRKLGAAILPDGKQRKLRKYIKLTHRNFSGYFVGKFIGSLIVFTLMLLFMSICGVPYAFLISCIVSVTDIIPVFGPILGAIPSFFIIFIVDPIKALIFVGIVIVVQQLEGNIITPKILGEATGISSLSVIIAIIIMGDYFGIIGMIVGVPVFAVIITVGKEMIETRLRKKNKATDTAEYYLADSVVDPYEQHETFAQRIFGNLENAVKKAVKKLKRSGKAGNAAEQTNVKNEQNEGEKNDGK